MRKFLKLFWAAILCAAFCVSVCACSCNGNSDDSEKDNSSSYSIGDDVEVDIY